jgi:hypothetical protein
MPRNENRQATFIPVHTARYILTKLQSDRTVRGCEGKSERPWREVGESEGLVQGKIKSCVRR